MLGEIYKLVTPWAESSDVEILKNRILGVATNILYPVYCKFGGFKKIKKMDSKIIVSLTTFPERIPQAYYCLNSLLRQTIMPERVVLWLATEQFPNRELDIPSRILALQCQGLEIKFCDDFRSYKKIFPAATEFSDRIIITADDDTLYPEDWIEKLVDTANEYPQCIVCYRAHEIVTDGNRILEYKRWKSLSRGIKGPLISLIPIGVGGVLYPIYFFEDIEFDYNEIQKLAPTTDDIWLKIQSVKKKIPVVKVNLNSKEWFTVRNSQRISLKSYNVTETNSNDIALNNLLQYYNLTFKDFL